VHHHLKHDRANLHANFSNTASPVLTIDSGNTVTLSAPDVGWGLAPPTSTTAPRRKVEPREAGMCMVGPIAVRGATPGDVLEIEIEHVLPGPWGWTYAGRGVASVELNEALGIGAAPLTLVRWTIDHERGVATSDVGAVVPLAPFPGTIGLAPDEASASGWIPTVCGGNMDCRELVAGSTLLLPVKVTGGLLSIGDGHAAQGDGELSGSAIECMLEALELTITLRRGMRINGPRIHAAPDANGRRRWITLGFGATLDGAASSAASSMLDLMEEQLGLPRAECVALASSCVDLRVTQMVNPVKGVHAVLRV